MVNIFDRIQKGLCGLHGHEPMVNFERDRMFMKCFSCGYESEGWTVNRTSLAALSRPDDSPQALRPPRFVGVH